MRERVHWEGLWPTCWWSETSRRNVKINKARWIYSVKHKATDPRDRDACTLEWAGLSWLKIKRYTWLWQDGKQTQLASIQQNEYIYIYQENLLLMKIYGRKFLPDRSPKSELFSFQHTTLTLSARVPTVKNTAGWCCCTSVNLFIPVKHSKWGPEFVAIFWQLTCCIFIVVPEESIVEWFDKVGVHAVNKVMWMFVDECFL